MFTQSSVDAFDQDSVYTLVDSYCHNFEDKIQLIEKCYSVLSKDPSRLFETINVMLKEFEIDENLTAMILSTKL